MYYFDKKKIPKRKIKSVWEWNSQTGLKFKELNYTTLFYIVLQNNFQSSSSSLFFHLFYIKGANLFDNFCHN